MRADLEPKVEFPGNSNSGNHGTSSSSSIGAGPVKRKLLPLGVSNAANGVAGAIKTEGEIKSGESHKI